MIKVGLSTRFRKSQLIPWKDCVSKILTHNLKSSKQTTVCCSLNLRFYNLIYVAQSVRASLRAVSLKETGVNSNKITADCA